MYNVHIFRHAELISTVIPLAIITCAKISRGVYPSDCVRRAAGMSMCSVLSMCYVLCIEPNAQAKCASDHTAYF